MGKRFSICLRFLLGVLFPLLSFADRSSAVTPEGFVVKSRTKHIAYHYTQGAPGAPTILLFNGLIFELAQFDRLTTALIAKGYSVVTYAYSVQPESIKTLGLNMPYFMDASERPTLQDLSQEGRDVLDQLKITTPVIFVGLSYGTGPSLTLARLAPDLASQIVLISPLAMPSDAYATQQKYLDMWNDMLNQAPILGPIWVEQTQENLVQYYASYLVSDPANKFVSGVDSGEIDQGIVAQIRAAENFRILDIDFRNLPQVDFIVSGKDVPLRLHDQLNGYRNMLNQGHDGSFTYLIGAPHASPAAVPDDVADMIDFYVQNKGQKGSVYTVDTTVDTQIHSRVELSDVAKQQLFDQIDQAN